MVFQLLGKNQPYLEDTKRHLDVSIHASHHGVYLHRRNSLLRVSVLYVSQRRTSMRRSMLNGRSNTRQLLLLLTIERKR